LLAFEHPINVQNVLPEIGFRGCGPPNLQKGEEATLGCGGSTLAAVAELEHRMMLWVPGRHVVVFRCKKTRSTIGGVIWY